MSIEPDPFRIIANLTHELKTPLHSILSVANILASEVDGALTDEQKKQVSIIQRNGDHLLELITDLLSYASVTSKSRKIRLEKIEPERLLRTMVQEISPIATKKGITIETDLQQAVPHFYTDLTLFNKTFSNLFSNAIKFTESGGQIYVSATEGTGSSLQINVSDTGIGMDSSSKERLFSAFYQADSSPTRTYGGVGLGLSLVHHAVQSLGGSIEVQSEPGQGSSFTVHLPDISDRVPSYKILICDSDESIRSSLQVLLEGEGYTVEVYDKKSEVDETESISADLILYALETSADKSTPTGEESIKSLRQSLTRSETPVLALISSSNPRERSQAFQQGIDDLLSKPFDSKELLLKIRLLIEKD